jgi:hypothetical protein
VIVKDDLKNEKSGECVVKEESLGVRGWRIWEEKFMFFNIGIDIDNIFLPVFMSYKQCLFQQEQDHI